MPVAIAKDKLIMADNLALPLDAVTQKLAFLGRTGSGKTYAATRLCEQMLQHNVQCIALDPVGVWYGLRLPAGKSARGFDIPVFGGLHGDIPIEPASGALIADLVTDRSLSAVLDVSQLLSTEQARFATDFATRFFQRKKAAPAAVHLFVEECQEFCPQNVMRGEERMLHAFERLIKLGRNFGIGASLISQRPQEVNKKTLNQTECLFAFQMTGVQERKAVEAWVADKGLPDDLSAILPHLEVGQPHVWSPQWLKISETVRILPKSTADASSTPLVGAASDTSARPLKRIDIEQIRAAMAATIERASEEDPKELRRRIADLQRTADLQSSVQQRRIADLQSALDEQQAQEPRAEVQTVEVPVIPPGDVERLASIAYDLVATAKDIITLGESIRQLLHANLDRPAPTPPAPPVRTAKPEPAREPARQPAPPVDRTLASPISAPQQRILDALAWWHAIGVEAPARLQVGFVAGYSAQGGTFSNYLGALRTAGLIDYPGGGAVALTEAGRQVAVSPSLPRTVEALQAAVIAKLPRPQARILQAACKAYPAEITRDEIAAAVEMSAQGGTFSNYLGALRSLGLLSYPGQGRVRATDLLFPAGLR